MPVEVACDESGYEGEKLVDTTGDVFTHAGIDLDDATAVACLGELRKRIRSPASQYGASHVLREKNRAVLVWLLGPEAQLLGHGHVHLIDKEFFLVVRLVELLTDGQGPRALYDDRRCFDPQHWHAFLSTANDLLRHVDRWDRATPLDSFFHMVDLLRARTANGVLDALDRRRAEAVREQLFDDPQVIRPADPLVPAILRAADYWGPEAEIAHDRQNLLSTTRIEQIKAISGLRSFRLVSSQVDLRIQLADMLAGVVRVIATDELNGRGDPELTALARPYVDERSVWADAVSWARLKG